MKQFVISVGNFFFRWRDTAFPLFLLAAFVLVAYPGEDLSMLPFSLPPLSMASEIGITVVGLVITLMGMFARAITIGFAYIKRGGLNKQIYAETLVRRGMFAHCRNPLYLGNILILTGGIVVVNQFWYWLVVLPLFYFIYYAIIKAEENFLGSKFGPEYQDYLKEVNSLIPGNLSKWNESIEGMSFTFKRLFNKEHGTIFLVLTTLTLYNLLKFHFRYDMAWDGMAAILHYGLIGFLVLFQITASVMKRTGKLTWDPNRP